MKIIANVCEKGGTAKTTLATTTAAGLAAEGYRVMLVDSDSQGHATLAMRQQPTDGLAGLLLRGAAFRDVVKQVDPALYGGGDGFFLLLPGGAGNRKLVEDLTHSLLLAHRLRELDGYLDYVVIDTAPAITKVLTAVYFAATHIVFPTQCRYLSVAGLQNSVEHLERAQRIGAEKGHPVARMLGIVPTIFKKREIVQYQNLGWLKGKYGDGNVLEPIGERATWEQASAKRQPVFTWEPKSEAAKQARQFIAEVGARL